MPLEVVAAVRLRPPQGQVISIMSSLARSNNRTSLGSRLSRSAVLPKVLLCSDLSSKFPNGVGSVISGERAKRMPAAKGRQLASPLKLLLTQLTKRIGTAAAGLIALLLIGCSTVPQHPATPVPEGVDRIYVIDRGWHTEIGLPVAELHGKLARIAADFPGATSLTVGFGDRLYLLNRDTDFFDMLRALLPGRAALLVTGLRVSPEAAFGADNVVTLAIGKPQLDALERYLASYFATDRAGQPLRLADGPYPGSLFFASDATYDALHTCNTWTAESLRAGGYPVSTTLVIFAPQVMAAARDL
jgi:uncharacterized protein (TIGR02117 family)